MNKETANRARALGWTALLGALLLFPADLLAQKEKTTGSSRSSGSSASPAPSRSSGSSARSASPSRSSRASQSKGVPRSTSKAKASTNRALKSQAKVGTKPSSPVRTPVADDNHPRRGYEGDGPYRSPKGPDYRTRGRHHHGGYGGYYGYPYYGRYGYYGYPYSRYPSYFYGPYGYFYYPYGGVYAGGGRGPRYGNVLGALDLNVKPKKAEVFLDGNPIGAVDRYDGFPSYLWLEPGTYTVAFYLEGHQTVSRQYTLYPGVVLDVKERLPPGVAERPEPPLMESVPQPGESSADGAPAAGDDGVGRLQLSILPEDTAVYLDGHFLGTGGELSQLSAGLIVEPGDHVLELVRPGYVTEEVPLAVPAGDRIDVDLSLRPR